MGQAKLTRALMRGGVAERRADGAYKIWRCRNRRRRALGLLNKRRGDELRADGKITLLKGEIDLYGWVSNTESRDSSGLSPVISQSLSKTRKPSQSLLSKVLGEAQDKRERARFSDAMKKFLNDAECANSTGRVTMNWQRLAS